jgi:hypothetical protein
VVFLLVPDDELPSRRGSSCLLSRIYSGPDRTDETGAHLATPFSDLRESERMASRLMSEDQNFIELGAGSVAGALPGMLLADAAAHIIKLELPDGDRLRMTAYWHRSGPTGNARSNFGDHPPWRGPVVLATHRHEPGRRTLTFVDGSASIHRGTEVPTLPEQGRPAAGMWPSAWVCAQQEATRDEFAAYWGQEEVTH